MDSHEIAERSRLIAHRLYARELTPALIEQALRLLERGELAGATTGGEKLWLDLLRRTPSEIVDRMTADTPEGRLLRSNSPFSLLIGIAHEEQRREIWRQAKSELSA